MCDNEDLLVDVEAVGGSIEDLAVSLRIVTMPDTRENVLLECSSSFGKTSWSVMVLQTLHLREEDA